MAASQARLKHSLTPNLVVYPTDWIQAYVAKTRIPLVGGQSSVALQRLHQRIHQHLCTGTCQKQSVAFLLPAVQDDRLGWWEAQYSISALCCKDFLPQSNFQGLW